jgi:GrpB-like predicted nucleotidyltransferase (UPF0157 family)
MEERPMAERVELVGYDEAWPGHFLAIAGALRTLLEGRVVAIEHIGSTSIPGISAKPLIDIDVILRNSREVEKANSVLEAAGYEPRGNRYDRQVFAFMKRSTATKQRVYLCPECNDTHRRRILFRDYLRAHPQTAAAYEVLKLTLCKEFEYDSDGYTAAKAAFVNGVVDRARLAET